MSVSVSAEFPFSRDELWAWYTTPGSAARLMPHSLPITSVHADGNVATGSNIYSFPAGLKWVTRYELSEYQRGRSFTEVCVRAPFRRLTDWRHEHYFADAPNGGTLMRNNFIANFPDKNVRAFFGYQHHQVLNDLSFAASVGLRPQRNEQTSDTPPVIAVTGANSVIGQPLVAQLRSLGFVVRELRRNKQWNPKNPSPSMLQGCDLLIHLAGESIQGRANDGHYQSIASSRMEPTVALARLVAQSPTCRGMIIDSVDCGDERLNSIFREVEDAARAACPQTLAIRRSAIFSARAGLLPLLRAVHKTGLGGKLAALESHFQWISIDDLTDIYIRAALEFLATENQDPDTSTPLYYSAFAPEQITTAQLMDTLARRFNSRTIIPIPDFSPKLLLGEPGARLLIAQEHQTEAHIPAEHSFRYPTVDSCFAHELMGEKPFSTD
ncbi:MAG: hypothetical protein Q3972_07360 [Corynebacterium sp.]|nr:hypothetical protein [Corynebacterium sp.]